MPSKCWAFSWGRKMPLPNILEFIGTNITQRKFQEAQEKLLNYLGIEVPTKTELNSEISKLNNAITPKADKIYVDTALAGFTNGVSKFYPTLALANADITNITIKDKVDIGEIANGGTWYKATAGATNLTKSPYDPLTQAKADATTKANAAEANAKALTKDVSDIIDVSVISGNYNLTFTEAVALIPTDLKKRFVTIKYNNSEVRTYVNDTFTTNWTNERFWIRKINTMSEAKVNHVDERMIYKGFIINGTLTTQFHADNYCMIIPVYRLFDGQGVERKLNLFAYPVSLLPTTLGFLDGKGVRINALNSTSNLSNYTIPAGAEYLFINLQWIDTTTSLMVNEGNLDIAKKYLMYIPDNSSKTTLVGTKTGFSDVEYGAQPALSIEYSKDGLKAIQPYFKSNLSTVNGLHISQVVKNVEVQKGQRSLRKPNGEYRRFWLWSFEKTAPTKLTVQFKAEYENGTEGILLPVVADIVDGIASMEWVAWYGPEYDSARVRIVVDASKLPATGKLTFGDNGEIHSSLLEKANRVRNVNKGLHITQFADYGVSSVESNMALPPANPIGVTRKMINGFAYNEVAGDSAKDHQQTTLIGSKYSNFFGNANLYVHVDAAYASQPKIKVLNEGSAVESMPILSGGQELKGRKDSQQIHPDICYSPDSIGGYKYWMINSNFPFGSDVKEDADLFVGNDGQNWKRVRGAYESSDAGVGFKLPAVPWNTEYPNALFPIPINGNTFEFAQESTIENGTITKYLAHDPFITCHGGYVIVYLIYNLALTGTVYQHKYTVCYRTNDGVNWEIVREDGSAMPFNAENAMKIFTKTNGVRNHHRYVYRSTGASDIGFAPQVVKVSDTEWYVYNRENNLVPETGQTMGLARFKGTTPYTIDYTVKEIVSKNDSTGGLLWHFGARYYNGVFYILTNGFMFTSTDGLNFTTVQYPFFWRGMSSDLYKPSFVVGHDGKVKIAYGIQMLLASPHAYAPQTTVSPAPFNKIFNGFKLCATLICEYPSLADIVARGSTPITDAYADIVLMVVSQREKTTGIHLLPCVREFSELQGINISYDDEVYVSAYLNTRNGGKLNFGGVAVTLPGAANK